MNELRGEALASATLEYIRTHPEEWDQNDYFCGTTACFAGHALVLSGKVMVMPNQFNGRPWYQRQPAMYEFGEAAEVLGWNCSEAAHVFYNGATSFEELACSVKEVLNGDFRDQYGEEDE